MAAIVLRDVSCAMKAGAAPGHDAHDARGARRAGAAVIVPALALLPGAGYMGLYCARWSGAGRLVATLIGLLIFAVLYLPTLRVVLPGPPRPRAFQPVSPKRMLVTALPLAGLLFALPTLNLVANVYIATMGRPLRTGVVATALVVVSAGMAFAYVWPTFIAECAVATGALAAVDSALLAAAASLLVMAIFVRLTSEAQHFHGASLALGMVLQAMALACAVAAVVVSFRRWRWIRAAFHEKDTGWGVAAHQPSHGAIPPLDMSDASASAGALVQFFSSDALAPYRASGGAAAVARMRRDAVLDYRLRKMITKDIGSFIASTR